MWGVVFNPHGLSVLHRSPLRRNSHKKNARRKYRAGQLSSARQSRRIYIVTRETEVVCPYVCLGVGGWVVVCQVTITSQCTPRRIPVCSLGGHFPPAFPSPRFSRQFYSKMSTNVLFHILTLTARNGRSVSLASESNFTYVLYQWNAFQNTDIYPTYDSINIYLIN